VGEGPGIGGEISSHRSLPVMIDETLRRLVSSVLEAELDRRDPAELTSAAALLATARDVIGSELFLVEPGEQLDGSPTDRRRLHLTVGRRRARRVAGRATSPPHAAAT
jgi:hypothetical protein